MYTVRVFVVAALSAIVIALSMLVGSQASPISAGATAIAPSWQTAAAYTPLSNVSAVSCAPNAAPSATTCVAVGDDGGNVASVIVSQNGGATWSRSAPPSGVTALSAVSCPSAAICYAGGGSGIFKSTNGGASWTVQDSSFPAQSISCFTIDECTAVEGIRIVETSDGSTWNAQTPPSGTGGLFSRFPAQMRLLALRSGNVGGSPAIVGTVNGGTWTTIDRPAVNFLESLSCSTGTTCVAVGIAVGRRSDLPHNHRLLELADDKFDPLRVTVEFRCLPGRNNLYRRRHQPQLHPICGRDL